MANSPKDVMSALCNQLDGFKQYMIDAHEHGIGFKLINDDPDGMDYSNVLMGCNRLVIAPVVSDGGTVGRILVGVALIALAFVPVIGAAAIGTFGSTPIGVGSLLFSFGTGMVLTGIASLLTPPVETPKGEAERKDSFLFDRATELTSQGVPIPLLYGRFLAQSPLIISSSLSTQQVAV
jgi:predicted phage tail protein